MKNKSLVFGILDNGMGLSRTAWGASMFHLGLSGVLKSYDVTIRALSYPYPAGAMEQLTADFLETGADRLIVIDTDESFEPVDVERLLSHDVPFVSGLYCKKEVGLSFPIELLDPDNNPFADNPFAEGVEPLVEVARCARGFLNVHREVFETLKWRNTNKFHDAQTGRLMFSFWEPLPGGHSEDFAFCDRYRAVGGRILIDQRITVKHHGSASYPIPGTYYLAIDSVTRNK